VGGKKGRRFLDIGTSEAKRGKGAEVLALFFLSSLFEGVMHGHLREENVEFCWEAGRKY